MKNIIIISIIAFLLASCGNKTADAQLDESKPLGVENVVVLTDAQYKNANIEIGSLKTKALSSVIKVSGKIQVPPEDLVSISVPMEGYLQSTKLLPGASISKGQLIAVLKGPKYIQLQRDYLTTKARNSNLKAEYNRQKELNVTKATSDKIFQQAKADFLESQAIIKALEEQLKLIGLSPEKVATGNISRTINIYSPINGYVSVVNVNVGKFINPSDVLFQLIRPKNIYLSLQVFGADISKIAVGQNIMAFTNEQPDKKYACKIEAITGNISDQNATEVLAHFKNYDKSLLPGMFMNAEIETFLHDTPAVPDEAVVRFGEKRYVFITKRNNEFEMVPIQPGDSENGFTAVLNANSLENKKIVIKGAYNLLMALKNEGEE